MNARIDQAIEGKEVGSKLRENQAAGSSSDEEVKSLREEMARMKATYESAMNAAQREFTQALEKERQLSAEKKERSATPV